MITRSPRRPRASYLAALPCTHAIETQSLPSLLNCYRCSFTFYVADPSAPFPLARVRRFLCLASCSLARRLLLRGGETLRLFLTNHSLPNVISTVIVSHSLNIRPIVTPWQRSDWGESGPTFAKATARQAWPVGRDHDSGGVFSGRANGSCRDTMERLRRATWPVKPRAEEGAPRHSLVVDAA